MLKGLAAAGVILGYATITLATESNYTNALSQWRSAITVSLWYFKGKDTTKNITFHQVKR